MPRSSPPFCALSRRPRRRLAIAVFVSLAACDIRAAAADPPAQPDATAVAAPSSAAPAAKPKPAEPAESAAPPAAADGAGPASLSLDEVRGRLDAVANDASLEDEVRAALREQYEKTVAAIKQAAASAEAREAALADAGEQPADLDLPAVDPAAEIAEIETARREATAKLEALTAQLQSVRTTISDRRKESKG